MITKPVLTAAILVIAQTMIGAPPALARHGEGLYGPADDLVVTNFGMGLVAFFTVLVFALSGAQYLLERRKGTKRERAQQHR